MLPILTITKITIIIKKNINKDNKNNYMNSNNNKSNYYQH